MKRVAMILLIVLAGLMVLGSASSGNAGSVSEAKEFMENHEFSQAISTLKEVIQENPAHAEAHFQLGVCYVFKERYPQAEKSFSKAIDLNPDYTSKIGIKLKKLGFYYLDKRQMSSVREIFYRAVKYKPELKEDISRECFNLGKEKIEKNDFTSAGMYFSFAHMYKPSLRKKIGDLFHSRVNKISSMKEKKRVLKFASSCNDKYRHEYGQHLLKMVTRSDSESERKELIREAAPYVSPKEILKANLHCYIRILGSPRKVVLDNDKWKKIGNIKKDQEVHYLSLNGFFVKWRDVSQFRNSSFREKNTFNLFSIDEGGADIYLTGKDGSIVYCWKKE